MKIKKSKRPNERFNWREKEIEHVYFLNAEERKALNLLREELVEELIGLVDCRRCNGDDSPYPPIDRTFPAVGMAGNPADIEKMLLRTYREWAREAKREAIFGGRYSSRLVWEVRKRVGGDPWERDNFLMGFSSPQEVGAQLGREQFVGVRHRGDASTDWDVIGRSVRKHGLTKEQVSESRKASGGNVGTNWYGELGPLYGRGCLAWTDREV